MDTEQMPEGYTSFARGGIKIEQSASAKVIRKVLCFATGHGPTYVINYPAGEFGKDMPRVIVTCTSCGSDVTERFTIDTRNGTVNLIPR